MDDVNGPRSGSSRMLPLVGAEPRERADAARNRRRILAAAQQLFDERGIDAVTMDDVVAAAGVGKGTLFRRFTDRRGLAMALLDQHERDVQQRILSGPPPLGPGAPAADRLAAFVDAYLRHVDARLGLVLLSETSAPGARLSTGVYRFWRQHCVHLLRTLVPDPELRAEMLMAALAADQVRHWLRERHHDPAVLADTLAVLASAPPVR